MFNLAVRIAVEDWARRGAESPDADREALTGAMVRTVATASRALED
jgi:hypothetical protein